MTHSSIGFRLVVWYTSLLSGIFVLLAVLLYFGLQHFVLKDTAQIQMSRARQIADTLLAHVQNTGEPYVIEEIKSLYAPEINNRFIRVTRANGDVIYESGDPKDNSFKTTEVPSLDLDADAANGSWDKKMELSDGGTLVEGVVKVSTQGKDGYYIEVGALLDPAEAMLNHLFVRMALGLPLAVLIIGAGGWILVRRALKPVAEITQAAELITQHNTSDRMPVARTGDELEALSLALNRMIARLDDAFKNSTRFVADASHELRTPLTILHGELEMLAAETSLTAETRDRVYSMLEEVSRLGKIVEQLFALSRLDAGEAQTEWQTFDLAELARSTTEQMSLLAEDKGISIRSDASNPVTIQGDKARLKQVIVNLLDNAIKYTPSQGSVQLCVRESNGEVYLEVADNGMGIPVQALPHVFERFYRVDPARSGDSGGAGLGLSIVKSICTAHGATVEVQSNPRTGSCFSIKFSKAKI